MIFSVAINYSFVGKMAKGNPRWKEFNNSFQRVETNVVGLAQAIYAGHAHCAVHARVSHRKQGRREDGTPFEYNGAYRDSANFVCLQTACLDFDGKGKEDSIDSLLLNPFISKRAGILYATSSSTPSAPRTRVVFVLEKPIACAEDARLFMKALTGHYPRADKTGADIMKPWSGSLDCDMVVNEDAFIPDDLVTGMAYHMRRQEEAIAERQRRYLDDLSPDNIRDKLRDALRFVPKRMDYGDWIKALMAIWIVFPDERGIALAEEWSPGTPNEVANKFKSFRDVRIEGDWIFRVAYRRGWRPPGMEALNDQILSLILRG